MALAAARLAAEVLDMVTPHVQPGITTDELDRICHEALMAGIAQVRPGATLSDVGHAIQAVARREGHSVVREDCGHGIGQTYHDVPEVLHFGRPGQGLRLQAGMIFTIVPMLNAGHPDVVTLKDGWTVVTKDSSLSAQWEHMVLVTPTGSEILTLSPMLAQAA